MATKVKTGVIDSSAITSALIANASITADDLHATLDLTGKTVTVATASAGDNDTSVASTAFVSTAIANLADSAPSTLNTLNELAAALGDDANYATTTTNAIAAKAPLASPSLTGNVGIGQSSPSSFDAGANNLVIGATSDTNSGLTIASSGSGIIYFADGTSGDTAYRGTIAYGHADDAMIFRTGGFTERLRIASSGQLGIGGANYGTDGQVLTSTGTGSAPAWEAIPAGGVAGIVTSADATAITIGSDESVTFANVGTFGGTVTALTNFNSTSGNDLRLNAGSANRDIFMQVNGTTHMTVQGSTGNVGIGTASPGAKLEIKNGDLWLNAVSSSYNPEIFFIDDAGPTGIAGIKIRYGNSSGNLYFDHKWDNAGSGFFFRNRVDGTALNTMALINGKVGIGNISPAVSLDVTGTDAIRVPNGTTAQRPTGALGQIRYNTTNSKMEGYIGGQWANIATSDNYPVTTNLYARYTGDSYVYNGSSTPNWNDTSGNGRNINATSTSNGNGFWARSSSTWPTIVSNSGNGADNTFNCIQFDKTEALALPDDTSIGAYASTGWTFAYVARYAGSSSADHERLMAGKGSNNLLGFWGGTRGVFFDGSWLVGPSTQHSIDVTDWTIIIIQGTTGMSKTKDNNSGNFVTSTIAQNYTNAAYSATGARYGLNYHDHGLGGSSSTENSVFEIAEWAMFDRTLTTTEMTTIGSFLETKYGI